VNFFTVLLNDFDVIRKTKIRVVIIQLIRSTTKKEIISICFACFDNFIKKSKEKIGFEIFLLIYPALI